MHLKNLTVSGFLGNKNELNIKFNRDINIVTGYNGAGKTNLLKLLWYTISGNITQMLKEVTFADFYLQTSHYSLFLNKHSEDTCAGWIETDGSRKKILDQYDDDRGLTDDARDVFSSDLQEISGSLFFPTFRRIEGGFTISGDEKTQRRLSRLSALGRGTGSDLQKAVIDVAQRLTNDEHQFITSISTVDIADLLLRRYTLLTEQAAQHQSHMTQEIITDIRNFKISRSKQDTREDDDASRVLDSIAQKIEQADLKRERTMAPFHAVQNLVAKIFRHKGIQFTTRLSFGDAAEAINSDLLSAGEKQMLSFICYNAFYKDQPIFIDEPELSLHVDWQRTLFPTLESQDRSNQFIVATHSPFIYSKYPEKEIALVDRRGDEEGHD